MFTLQMTKIIDIFSKKPVTTPPQHTSQYAMLTIHLRLHRPLPDHHFDLLAAPFGHDALSVHGRFPSRFLRLYDRIARGGDVHAMEYLTDPRGGGPSGPQKTFHTTPSRYFMVHAHRVNVDVGPQSHRTGERTLGLLHHLRIWESIFNTEYYFPRTTTQWVHMTRVG